MKKSIVFVFVLLFLLARHSGLCATNSCQVSLRAEDNDMGSAKLFADPIAITAFHLRFIDGKTKKEITPSKINITYHWKWLEYPYPEHSWGVWSTASDRVECVELGTEIAVPEYVVQPRGWYDGKYTKFPFTWKGPSFTGIDISMYDVGCSRNTWITLSPKEVFKLNKNNSVTIEINCTGRSTFIIK